MNKLTKARKTCKSPGTLGLKKFGTVKLWVEKDLINFLAKLEKYCILSFFLGFFNFFFAILVFEIL